MAEKKQYSLERANYQQNTAIPVDALFARVPGVYVWSDIEDQSFYAVRKDFVNMQESQCGIGATANEAIDKLITIESGQPIPPETDPADNSGSEGDNVAPSENVASEDVQKEDVQMEDVKTEGTDEEETPVEDVEAPEEKTHERVARESEERNNLG